MANLLYMFGLWLNISPSVNYNIHVHVHVPVRNTFFCHWSLLATNKIIQKSWTSFDKNTLSLFVSDGKRR